MLKNVLIALSGPVMNIKLALKICHFDILSDIGWLQQLNQWHGPAIIFTQQTIEAFDFTHTTHTHTQHTHAHTYTHNTCTHTPHTHKPQIIKLVTKKIVA